MIAVMNIPKMEVAPASAAAAAEGFPEHMGALSVGIDRSIGGRNLTGGAGGSRPARAFASGSLVLDERRPTGARTTWAASSTRRVKF